MSVDGGEFEKLIAKPKCKSKMWKRFVFPANAHSEIMDKKKIVCRLCKAIIAYLGNTSNLTYHLQRAHSQELVELCEDSGDRPGPSECLADSEAAIVEAAVTPGDLSKINPISSGQHKA